MGYKIRRWAQGRKNNTLAFILLISGIAVNVCLGYINYRRGLSGLPVDVISFRENPFSYAPLAPIEVIASCLVFAGFSVMNVKKDFSRLASKTFYIYLIHAGVLNAITILIGDKLIGKPIVETTATIVISTVVFFVSLLAAVVYEHILPKFKKSELRIKT